jgi:hypothetical protein
MIENESILEKVIATQINEEKAVFNPKTVVLQLLDQLPEREKEIVTLRHGLNKDNKKYTLEDIGRKYNITRERVRQIEVASVKLLKKQLKDNSELNYSLSVVEQIIRDDGGVIENIELINKVKEVISERIEENYVIFFLGLIKDRFIQIKDSNNVKAGWQLPDFDIVILNEIIKYIEELISKTDKLYTVTEIWQAYRNTLDYKKYAELINENVFLSFIKLSKKLKANPYGDWGLKSWNLITPRRMNDKIYLVLKHNGKPLHFRDIAKTINAVKFDGKKAHDATVHNELILDHSRYVLIGRGIYALKEWGYKSGVVSDVIREIVKKQSLRKEEIIKAVLECRQVKESTIVLSLMNKKIFKKNLDGTYQLVEV